MVLIYVWVALFVQENMHIYLPIKLIEECKDFWSQSCWILHFTYSRRTNSSRNIWMYLQNTSILYLTIQKCYTSTYANQQILYSSFHHELKSSTNCIDILLWFPFNLWMEVGIIKDLNAWALIAWLLVLPCNLIAYKKSSSSM